MGKGGERYPTFYVLQHFANAIPAGSVLVESRSDDSRIFPLVFRRPDGRTAAIVLNDNRAERTFTLAGLDARVSEWTMSSDGAYGVRRDPETTNRPEGIAVTLPPLSIISIMLE
ncbi:MAG: hypothetical protein JXA89_13225 [Anaerolineae bacterium]|nr:hypothetical protein [Anaerolineae bacterium]